jgi:hypothetical protein
MWYVSSQMTFESGEEESMARGAACSWKASLEVQMEDEVNVND